MARPTVKGLKYFPFDVGFFRDKKIRLLRGQHGADGVEVYQRILCACYEGDNGYYLPWNANEDYALMAEDTGYSEEKVRLIVSSCLNWSLFDDTLFKAGNVLTSRSIQRRYFGAIKETKSKAAAQGRHTIIPRDICLLFDDDFSELNKTTPWLQVGNYCLFSENNTPKSTNNNLYSANNPPKEIRVDKIILDEGREDESSDTPPVGGDTPENSSRKSVKGEKPPKHRYGEYKHVLLTDAEYQRIVVDKGLELTDAAIRHLDEYIEMKGYKAKNHSLALRKWVFIALAEEQQRAARTNINPPPKQEKYSCPCGCSSTIEHAQKILRRIRGEETQ